MSDNSDQQPEDHYSKHYSEESFLTKAGKIVLKVGRGTIGTALTLYYCLQDRDTPNWAKATIIGSLGYFIFPIDAIPDLIPVVGYADDTAGLGLAVAAVAAHIKEEHKQRAKEQIDIWLNGN